MHLEGTPGQRLCVCTAEPATSDHDAMLLLGMTAPEPVTRPDAQTARQRPAQS
ncbi:hypothetical protein [Streptomyces swartbergensis]|uniref:hypothetical protein n=1 Tax=Streptomyces swartbergensis TaxID=487165 RepID=UPI0037FE6119